MMVLEQTIRLEDIAGVNNFRWPKGAEALNVIQRYPGLVSIWYRCDPTQPIEDHMIAVVRDREECLKHARYFGTMLYHYHGDKVMHFFDDYQKRAVVVQVPADMADRDVTEPIVVVAPKAYQCGVCKSIDPDRYMVCDYAGCPDGRDR